MTTRTDTQLTAGRFVVVTDAYGNHERAARVLRTRGQLVIVKFVEAGAFGRTDFPVGLVREVPARFVRIPAAFEVGA